MALAQESSSPATSVDVFILFNEKEDIVVKIETALQSRGISTYLWRRDAPVGSRWRDIEDANLNAATTVAVFLGDLGWGPTHLPLAVKAQSLNKHIIPVLIGSPSSQAISEAGGLFDEFRYVDLRDMNPTGVDALVKAILDAKQQPKRDSGPERDRTSQFDGIISALVDRSDDERLDILQQVVSSQTLDKPMLGARLREEIQTRFGPENESRFGNAIREPKKLASIRSWMFSCLIWVDAQTAASRNLILRHLQFSFDPDRNVRFWTLAGLYQCNVPYLGDAASICASSPEPEIALLAQTISRQNASQPIEQFRAMLSSDDFQTAWAVLRLLRIRPIPELTDAVCAQLGRFVGGTDLSYDALYALANPLMTTEAIPILREGRGVPGLAAIVVALVPDSDRRALQNFAALLAAFEPYGVIGALVDIEKDPARAGAAAALRRLIEQLRKKNAVHELFVAGFASDTIDVENDYLDIREDVQTLAAVMLAKEVTPPLAIGLFGDWGSGKSFFMESMNAAVTQIAKKEREKPQSKFCSAVVQVKFNAWHYADANLLASLVSQILEGLTKYLSNEPTAEEQLTKYIEQLKDAKREETQVVGEKRSTDKEIEKHQVELQGLQTEREQKEIELRDLRFADLRTLFSTQPDVKATLDESLQQLGVPAALSSEADLAQVMSEVNSLQGRATAFLIGLFSAQNRLTVITLLAGLTVVPFLAALIYHYLSSSFVFVGTFVAEGAMLIGGVVSFLRNAADYLKTHLDNLQTAKTRVDALLAEKRKVPGPSERALQEEITSLKVREEQTTSRMRAATEKVIDLEQRIAALQDGRSLTRFLSERTRSDDYRKYLGLISTIRRDFEGLTERLMGSKNVERIILYIDDLDRCPADKVVDVLQAVHLLLAYPLFIVVVGVDPRWLTHSLTATYATFKDVGDGSEKKTRDLPINAELWRTTPQNYLEKIFQIPISLRPMTTGGYSELVKNLFAPTKPRSQKSPPDKPPVNPDVPPVSPDVPPVSPDVPPVPPDPINGVKPPPVQPPPPPPADPDQGFVIHEEALTIRSVEMNFAAKLFGLLPTPRATKRFSNIYRILKAPIPLEQLAPFEGTEHVPGTFQVPMLLLAILIGMPDLAVVLFPKLYQHAIAGKDPFENLDSLEIQGLANQREKLRAVIDDIGKDSHFPRGAKTYEYWLPRISRFSFETGRTLNPAPAAGMRS